MSELIQGAAGVSGIWSLAAFAIAALMAYLLRQRGKVPAIAWAIVIIVALLGLVPVAGSMYVQVLRDQSVYQVSVNVVDSVNVPVPDVSVSDSLGDAASVKQQAWQFEIPKQRLPANGRVTIYASKPSAFMSGAADITLGEDLRPSVTIVMKPLPQVRVRGVVQDTSGRLLGGVRVSVDGHDDEAQVTEKDGRFDLPAHAAQGQQLLLSAAKASYQRLSQQEFAGDGITLTLVRE